MHNIHIVQELEYYLLLLVHSYLIIQVMVDNQ